MSVQEVPPSTLGSLSASSGGLGPVEVQELLRVHHQKKARTVSKSQPESVGVQPTVAGSFLEERREKRGMWAGGDADDRCCNFELDAVQVREFLCSLPLKYDGGELRVATKQQVRSRTKSRATKCQRC